MNVTCPNCQTKYNLPEDKIGPDGAKVRCTRCKHVFSVNRPHADFPEDDIAPPPRGEAVGAGEEDLEDLFGAPPPKPEKAKAKSDEEDLEDLFGPPPSKSAAPPAREEPLGEIPRTGDKGGVNLDALSKTVAEQHKKSLVKDTTKLIALIGAALALVLALTAGALYFFKVWPFGPAKGVDGAKPETKTEAPAKTDEKKADQDMLKNIALVSVRPFMVPEAKAGTLFVVEGKAKNNFSVPKEYLKIEATLFDEKGAALASKQIVAGNTVSYFQLQIMTQDELEIALTSQVGILTNNTGVRPGGEVPFMVVFYNPPDTLQEFGVKVIDVKDPPPQ